MRPEPLPRTIVTATLAALTLAGASPVSAASDGVGVRAIVQTLTRPPEELTDDERLRSIVELGPTAAASVFDLCAGRVDTTALGVEGPLLVDGRRELLLDALKRWSEVDVLLALEASASGGWSFPEFLTAVDLLGEVGGARSLAFLGSQLAARDPVEAHSTALTRRLRPALAAILTRDASAFDTFENLFEVTPRVLHPALADVLGDVGGADAFSILSRLPGRSVTLDISVLAAVGRLDPWSLRVPFESRSWLARRHLDASDPRVQRQALTTLGELRDADSVPEMLAALDEGRDERVRRAAHWAMQETAGLQWRFDPERWARWFEDEERWHALEFPDLVERAQDEDPAVAFEALRLLSLHPLYHSEMISAVAGALEHESVNVARVACGTLARLDDPAALEPLIAALDDPRTEVGLAARQALVRLTGEDLPASSRAWERWQDAR